ncbi:MAG: hypothetical protein ISS15_06870 [Alphaproteobacteria bacterium]|nr:hypothetical protein [Alphaproteobacteria bacterium]
MANVTPESPESKTSTAITMNMEADQLKQLIRKLRWIGQDQDAERMCARLAQMETRATVLSAPSETD